MFRHTLQMNVEHSKIGTSSEQMSAYLVLLFLLLCDLSFDGVLNWLNPALGSDLRLQNVVKIV